jgi:hypothetical protein
MKNVLMYYLFLAVLDVLVLLDSGRCDAWVGGARSGAA